MKILGTGMRGLIGSRMQELLGDIYEFENIDRSSGVDITDKEKTLEVIKSSDATVVLHMAAKTDVDGCEEDKSLGAIGDAWKINVEGTQNVVNACFQSGKKIIFISTDFVFDGNIETGQFYKEEDIPNPLNWYAQTKYEGEKIVQSLTSSWIIARLAYPYRASFEKNDFVRAIIGRLAKSQEVSAIVDHIFTPTFIDDIAFALDALLRNDLRGIYHVVGSQCLTPYEAAIRIAKKFNLDESLVGKITREEFFKDRAERPFSLALKNDKIEKLGVKMKSFDEGLIEMRKQL